ncbi:hypothetical protein Tco_1004452 [Tanacetum coccineum]|uniref:Reverse transcriptase domain-containing protein n=1 Tax=Tanacetum coccineum TaxID=301880 RepID=A0ABQ5FD33_9ASTR
MADNRTMAQMLQAPIEGYEDAIVVPPINANNFELKQPLINLVQSNKFTDGEARDWLDNENSRSILTWEDIASTSNSGNLPSQTVTNPRQQINTITTRSGKTLEEPSSSPVKTSDNIEKFTDELAPLDSLPENNKDVEIKSSSSSTLTSPEASKLEDYLEKDSIPPGIDLTLPTTLEVLSSNPTFPTLTKEKVCSWKTPMFLSLVRFVWKMMTRIAIRKKIMCILATYLHEKPKPLSQEVEEIKENEKEVSSDVPIDTIVMPIRITFDNPIDFNDHFSKLKDLKKDLPISFDLPPQKPPNECLKNAVLNFYQSKKTFPLNVEDVNSFAFIIWNFLPFFTYTEESPLNFFFRSENFVFDPGILTIQWQFQ